MLLAEIVIPREDVGQRVRRMLRFADLMQKDAAQRVGLSEAQMTQKLQGKRSKFTWAELYALAAVCAGLDLLRDVEHLDLLSYLTGHSDEIPGFELAPKAYTGERETGTTRIYPVRHLRLVV